MKYLIVIYCITFVLYFGSPARAEEQPAETVTTTTTQPPPVSKTPSQQVTTSNTVCVKVGSPTSAEPQECNKPGFTTSSDVSSIPPGSRVSVSPAGGPLTICTPGLSGEQICEEIKPPPIAASELKATIKSRYNVDMQGAWNPKPMQWIYEKFYELKLTNPRFMAMISGHPIVLGSDPQQVNNYVEMPQNGYWASPVSFVPVLIHELGHDIYWKNADSGALKTKYENLYNSSGKPVFTSYAAGYSGDGARLTENYAEIIAYCLTGDAVANHAKAGPGWFDLEMWATYYKTLAEEITGGDCRR